MSQPVKLSDSLVLDARVTGDVARRSIAGQIEYWARLGRAVEPLLQGAQSMALSRGAGAKPLSGLLESIGTEAGAERLQEHLRTLPHPRYEPVAGSPGLLIRTLADGTRQTGRFVNRKFKTVTNRSRRG
jgi:hypothetical protein